jgi:cytochrome P450
MSWTLVYLLTAPKEYRTRVFDEIFSLQAEHGLPCTSNVIPLTDCPTGSEFTSDFSIVSERMPLLDAFIQESLRLVQQSLTLRRVLSPVVLETERGAISVPPGVTIATLLSVTNTDASALPNEPNLNEFHAERYEVRCRLVLFLLTSQGACLAP